MLSNAPGFLIAIEGIDGAGKSTQADLLQKALLARGLPVLRSREPTDGPHGRRLRESAQSGRLTLPEEIELFAKDRQEHVEQKIAPALGSGQVVLLDRYYFSTAAYQGARGADPAALVAMNEAFAPEPDLLLLLDLPPQKGLERVGARGDRANLFEQDAALAKARQIFLALDKPYRVVIDATQPAAQVQAEILAAFDHACARRGV